MRTDTWARLLSKRLLDLLLGALVLAGFALLIRFGPPQPVATWGASLVVDLAAEPEQPRGCIGTELLGVEASEDFKDLVEAVSETREEPTTESVRRLMEERGWTGLRYTLLLRHLTDAGSYDDIQYVRRPYQAPFNAPEFLKLLTTAHVEADDVRIEVDGRRLDGRQAAAFLWFERSDDPSPK